MDRAGFFGSRGVPIGEAWHEGARCLTGQRNVPRDLPGLARSEVALNLSAFSVVVSIDKNRVATDLVELGIQNSIK